MADRVLCAVCLPEINNPRLHEPIDLPSRTGTVRLIFQSPQQRELAMLVLSCRPGEKPILDVSDGQLAKIGIEPINVVVMREH